jgi:hypothetical protein
MKMVRSFKTAESNYPPTRRNNPQDLVPQYENLFATNVFHLCVFSTRVETSHTFCLAFPLFLACYTSDEEVWLYYDRITS